MGGSGGADSPERVYFFTAPVDGTLVVSTDNDLTDFDTAVSIRTACDDATSEIACNDDLSTTNTRSTVSFDVVEGQTYFVLVEGHDQDRGRVETSFVLE